MNGMFSYCNRLQTLDLSGFDTSNVTDMDEMFIRCMKIKTLDVSSFDTSNVSSMYGTFAYCTSLEKIIVGSGWSVKSAQGTNTFEGSSKLKGASGTTYDAKQVDIRYARIDSGVKAPGYFTAACAGGLRVSSNISIIISIPANELGSILSDISSVVARYGLNDTVVLSSTAE
jgi:surface protein